jgi:hypothetical protein
MHNGYSKHVFFCRVNEKVATPTSVVLMAFNTVCGNWTRTLVQNVIFSYGLVSYFYSISNYDIFGLSSLFLNNIRRGLVVSG